MKDEKYGFGRLIDLPRAEPVTDAKHGRPVVVALAGSAPTNFTLISTRWAVRTSYEDSSKNSGVIIGPTRDCKGQTVHCGTLIRCLLQRKPNAFKQPPASRIVQRLASAFESLAAAKGLKTGNLMALLIETGCVIDDLGNGLSKFSIR